jgi:hypothetical protein
MEHDIAIRMRNDARGVSNPHTPEHYVLARSEGVHVKPLSNFHATSFVR